MSFFGQTPGLELAEIFWDRRVAFYWIGGRGDSMIGLWKVGTGPQRLSLHIAFRADLPHLLDAPARLRTANVVPLDFWGPAFISSDLCLDQAEAVEEIALWRLLIGPPHHLPNAYPWNLETHRTDSDHLFQTSHQQ